MKKVKYLFDTFKYIIICVVCFIIGRIDTFKDRSKKYFNWLAIILISFNCNTPLIVQKGKPNHRIASRLIYSTNDIIISKDTTINDTWVVGQQQVINFINSACIHGNGKLIGGIINAPITKKIFDTTFSIAPSGTYDGKFYTAWYSLNKDSADNSGALIKSINTVLNSNSSLYETIIPIGAFKYSRELNIAKFVLTKYAGAQIWLHGSGNGFWDADQTFGTTLIYTGTIGHAIGIQVGKGVKISRLMLQGQFIAPTMSDSAYFNLSYGQYTDQSMRTSYEYTGIAIDYDGYKGQSGSTGITIEDVFINGFAICYALSNNAGTLNGESIFFNNCRVGDCRFGFVNGSAQNKGVIITNMTSIGRCHTVFVIGIMGHSQGGQIIINGGIVAGYNIRPFWIVQSSWYSTMVYNLFCERIQTIGTITTTSVPMIITNSTFHFMLPQYTGFKRIALVCNSKAVQFNGCTIRYNDGKPFEQHDTTFWASTVVFSNGTYINTPTSNRKP